MPSLNKVAVIGGGIAGCSAAYALRQRKLSVTLFERGETLAGETSGNPLAVIEPRLVRGQDAWSTFFLDAWFFTTKLLDDLDKSRGNIWHPERGATFIGRSNQDLKKMKGLADTFQQHHGLVKFKDGIGLEFPRAGCLHPTKLCQALTEGVEIKLNAPVGLPEGFDATVLANGINAFDVFGDSPMRPNRGQINFLPALKENNLNQVISFQGGYLTPAVEVPSEGRVHILGASFSNWDNLNDESWKDLSAEDLENNLAALSMVRPDLAEAWASARLRGRTGLRATTLDHMPLVGPAFDAKKTATVFKEKQKLHHSQRAVGNEADIPGLYIMSGFASRGFTAAPLAAEILAAQITEEASPCPQHITAALDPKRFVIRKLKRV